MCVCVQHVTVCCCFVLLLLGISIRASGPVRIIYLQQGDDELLL